MADDDDGFLKARSPLSSLFFKLCNHTDFMSSRIKDSLRYDHSAYQQSVYKIDTRRNSEDAIETIKQHKPKITQAEYEMNEVKKNNT